MAGSSLSINQGSNYAGEPGSEGETLGFSPSYAGGYIGGVEMIPDVVIPGYLISVNPSAHIDSQVDETNSSDIWEGGATFTHIHGKHTFSMGGNLTSNNGGAHYLNSSVDFGAANTANAADGTGGNALASFLLGVPSGGERRNVDETLHGGWVDGAFFMDQYKVTSKLTINLGARYDVTLLPIYGDAADGNNFNGDMNFSNGTYILSAVPPSCTIALVAPCIPGTGLPAGVTVTTLASGAIFHTDWSNIQPRAGIAYNVLPRTVIRAGFGIFVDNWGATLQTSQNYGGSWPSIALDQVSNLNPLTAVPTVSMANPTGVGGLPGPTPFQGNSDWFADPYLKRPYTEQFNFGIQQQISSSTVLTINYVGSTGHRLDVGGAYNVATTPGGYLVNPNTGAPLPGNTQPFPNIEVVNWDRSVGTSNYNALQASLNGKAWHGLSYLLSYTWSRSFDLGCTGWYGVEGCSTQQPYNLEADRGPSAIDIPQILTLSWVYRVPFGKGEAHSTGNAVLDYVVGGWSFNGILQLTSGEPFDVGTGSDQAHTGNFNYGNGYGYERANFTGGSFYASNPSPEQWLNVAAFILPTLGHLWRLVARLFTHRVFQKRGSIFVPRIPDHREQRH